jgi:hypothetical protein
MTTPTAEITLTNIQTEFGGATPIFLTEYYANDTYVSLGMAGVPSSGQIAMSQLRGKNGGAGIASTSIRFDIPYGRSYVDYTLPSEKVWLSVFMYGGGGGGSDGDGRTPYGEHGGGGGITLAIVRLPNTVSTKNLRIFRGLGGARGFNGGANGAAGGGSGGSGFGFRNNVLVSAFGGAGGNDGGYGSSSGGAGGGGMSALVYWDNNNGIVVPILSVPGGGGAGGTAQNGGERRGNADTNGRKYFDGGFGNGTIGTDQNSINLDGEAGQFVPGDNGGGGGGGGGGGFRGTLPLVDSFDKTGAFLFSYVPNESSGGGGTGQAFFQKNNLLPFTSHYTYSMSRSIGAFGGRTPGDFYYPGDGGIAGNDGLDSDGTFKTSSQIGPYYVSISGPQSY